MVTTYDDELNPIYNKIQKIEHSKEDDIVIFIYGLLPNQKKTILIHVLSLIFFGIPYLLLYWLPHLQRYKYDSNKLDDASDVLIIDNFHLISIERIHKLDCYLNDVHELIRYFDYQHIRYVWNETRQEFEKFTTLENTLKLSDLNSRGRGLSENQQSELLKIYGLNKIQIEIKSYWNLFVNEVFHPFYVFQALSVILWCLDEYIEYGVCVFVISVSSIATSLYQTKKQSIALHELVEHSNICEMEVLRTNSNEKLIAINETEVLNLETVDACNLVPGDVIAIPRHGCIMPCDAIILSGNCIVNEAMLTGESIPVTKTVPNPSDEIYDSKSHRRHTLFSGTQVLQTRYYGNSRVLALVVGTGFNTSKGDLVKSILYPKPINYKFFQDAMRFVCLLFFVALIGIVYCVYLYRQRNATFVEILLRVLDIITIIVPPALPAAMTTGIIFSQRRLKKYGIFCISPLRINVAGRMKLVCFDKTGTLTNEGLNFYGVIPTINSEFTRLVSDLSEIDEKDPLIQTLGTCHSLTRLEGQISGDPLEVKMFEATSWILEEPGSECSRYDQLAPTSVYPPGENSDNLQFDPEKLPYQIGIIRQFPFSSSQQSMSVIARILGNRHMTLYVKGAPEKIVKLCDSSTVPVNFETFLRDYAMQGYRIIGLAYKNLDKKIRWKEALKVKREEIETNMQFLGLLIMQNTLKKETVPIIKELQNADIRNVMITGDNLMTAISVSQDCGLVHSSEHVVILKTEENPNSDNPMIPKIIFELVGSSNAASNVFELFKSNSNTDPNLRQINYHFAMSGETWSVLREYFESMIPKILIHGTIFARFAPEQKAQLVMCFQELDYVVGMVGDGANDCGALKAAQIGISLSDAEASVAAPFTSRISNISCVKHIILEGRCALVTSFAVFKYMTLYSFIQFISILILYTKKSIFGNMEFLFIDLVITTTLAVTMARHGPPPKMVSKRPMESLLSLRNVIPLAAQVLMCMVFQLLANAYLTSQSWYEPVVLDLNSEDKEVVVSWENTVIFLVSCFQYIMLAVVFSTTKLHRRPVYTNPLFITNVLILSIFSIYLLIYPSNQVAEFFEIIPIENTQQIWFRVSLLFLPITHLLVIIFIEFLANRKYWENISQFLNCKRKPENKYKELYNLVKISDYWLTQSDFEVDGQQC